MCYLLCTTCLLDKAQRIAPDPESSPLDYHILLWCGLGVFQYGLAVGLLCQTWTQLTDFLSVIPPFGHLLSSNSLYNGTKCSKTCRILLRLASLQGCWRWCFMSVTFSHALFLGRFLWEANRSVALCVCFTSTSPLSVSWVDFLACKSPLPMFLSGHRQKLWVFSVTFDIHTVPPSFHRPFASSDNLMQWYSLSISVLAPTFLSLLSLYSRLHLPYLGRPTYHSLLQIDSIPLYSH